MIKKYEGVSRREFLHRFLALWNVLQKPEMRLTDKESYLLVEFMALPYWYNKFRFSIKGKKEVIRSVTEKGWELTEAGLNQLLRKLEGKKVLRTDVDGYKILRPELQPFLEPSNKEFTFTFEFDINDEL